MKTSEVHEERSVSARSDYDFEVSDESSVAATSWKPNVKYLVAGFLFGIVLVKSQVMSWFRIQEMFRFQSFHMYGVIGSAAAVGMLSVWLIKYFHIRTIDGDPVDFSKKKFHKGNVIGGLIFGIGWALTGACPGPLFALIGSGTLVMIVALLSALAGTWVYGLIQHRLPH
jgi:uncharacterized protein